MRRASVVLAVIVGWSLACSGWFSSEEPAPAVPDKPALPSDPTALALGQLDETTAWPEAERAPERGRPTVKMGADATLPDDMPFPLPGDGWKLQVVLRNGPSTTVVMEPPISAKDTVAMLDKAVMDLGCTNPSRTNMSEAFAMECYDAPGFAALSWQVNPVGNQRLSMSIQYARTTP